MVIAVYKTRFKGIRLNVSGCILQPDRLNTGCHQPARVADKTSWRNTPPTSPTTQPPDPTSPQYRACCWHTDPHPTGLEPTILEARHPASHVPDSGTSKPCGGHYT